MLLIKSKACFLHGASIQLPWLIVFVSWLIPRLPAWLMGEPVFTGDTQDYLNLARHITSGNFEGYNALRTPGLPALMILSGFNWRVIWFFHSAMVLVSSTVIFILASRETRNPWVGCVAAVALNLSYLIFYEALLMTEVGTMFFVILALYFAADVTENQSRPRPIWVGLSLAGALLMRPSVLGVVPIFVFWMFFRRCSWVVRFRSAALTFVPVVCTWIAWAAFNSVTSGTFDYSVNTGLSLAGHSGPMLVRYKPPEWNFVTEVYAPLQLKRELDARHGVYFDTVWDSIEPFKEALNTDFRGVERLWLKVSLDLFRKYPLAYVKSITNAWPDFFHHPKTYIFFDAPSISLRRLLHLHGFEMTFINWIAVAASCFWLWSGFAVMRIRQIALRQLLAMILLGSSVFHAMMIPYALSRHGIPYSSVACLVAALACWDCICWWRKIVQNCKMSPKI